MDNLLTQKLIKEGYTAENHPEYVTYDKYYGFQYKFYYVADKTYKAPCGLLCKGTFCHSNMHWMGQIWDYEDDCPTIHCPKDVCECQMREGQFKSATGVLGFTCVVHETDEAYHYEESCEAVRHLYDDKIRRQKISFILEHNERVCENHMFYNSKTHEWSFSYDPTICANGWCRAQQAFFDDKSGYCPVLGRAISPEKGNVYYDVRYWGRDYSKDGTIFEGERFERIIKGKQVFKKPIRLDIAKIIANTCKDKIAWMERYNGRDYPALTMFLAEKGEIDLHWEIVNVRAEKKYSRDLEQDLLDIENGIAIEHDIDEKRKKQAAKHENREKRKEKRINRIEKLIKEAGYDNFKPADQRRADKLLAQERINELDEEFINREEEPAQMSVFDFIGEQQITEEANR